MLYCTLINCIVSCNNCKYLLNGSIKVYELGKKSPVGVLTKCTCVQNPDNVYIIYKYMVDDECLCKGKKFIKKDS